VRGRKKAPIEGYSAVPIEMLPEHVRPLNSEQMRQLIACEEFHEGRPEVLEILHDRLLRLEQGARPSEGPGRGPHE
jgi:hypothetical protein